MNNSTTCPRCGTPLGIGVAEGLCPKCVLAAGFESQAATQPDGQTAIPAGPAPSEADLTPHFPQLEILEPLGHGGMGWVFKARQKNLDRWVALKVLAPGIAGDPAFAERFQREARALARLNHPNIVGIHDFGQAGPYFYLVMEFVDGANLRQLERSRRLSPEEAFAIIPKICEALQFAHEEGIVHRDIKPENILLDSRGRLKIADFGIAKMVGQQEAITLTGPRHALGTPHYMAPEQFESPGQVDHRVDIYALGVVFYEMLTGELPIGRFELPSKMLQVDVRVDDVVLKSLERHPERRYQTVAAVKSDVDTLSQSAPVEATGALADHVAHQLESGAGVIGSAGAKGGGAAAASPGAAATPDAEGPLRKAWRDWWAERDRWVAISVQTALALGHLACLLAFFGTSIKNHWEKGASRQFSYTVGAVEPWYRFEIHPQGIHSGINFLSGSLFFLIAGFVLYFICWRIEKARKPNAGWWSSPAPLALFWGVWALAAIGMGMKLGNEALAEQRVGGGLLAPELQSAMEIGGTKERDVALRAVALRAVAAGDLPTVTRSVQEIRGDSLRDATAHECALEFAQRPGGADHALDVAKRIAASELRDRTLAAIAATPKAREPVPRATADTELIEAAARGDASEVGRLLDAGGGSVNQRDGSGRTPLIAAVANGHRSLAVTLLILGADLAASGGDGSTALMHAVEKGDRLFVSQLDKLWEISYEQDAAKRRETLLALPGLERGLLQGRPFDLVQFAVWHQACDQTNAQGETPCLIAARLGNWELFQVPARKTEALRARDRQGRNAAILFAESGNTAPFSALVESHQFGKTGSENGFVGPMLAFDVEQLAVADRAGRTAWQAARDAGHTDSARLLKSHLDTLISNESKALDRLKSTGLTDEEVMTRELSTRLEQPDAGLDPASRKRQLLVELKKLHYQRRAHAWQALGETAKAEADLTAARNAAITPRD
ncbi:MAG: protein kinase domain-containing protein [Verrucomicrobiales bacterium]